MDESLDLSDYKIGRIQTFNIFKGTNEKLLINFTLDNENIYEMQDGDTLIMTVLDYRDNDNYIIRKEISGNNAFLFSPEDTNDLDIGFYRYNIKFQPKDTNDLYEIIAPSIFCIKSSE